MRRQKGSPGLWIALFCSLVFVQFQASAGIRIPVPRQCVLATVSVSAESTAEELHAKVTEVEKFGNVVLDISEEKLSEQGFAAGDLLKLRAKGQELTLPLCTSYSDVDTGKLLLRDDTAKKRVLIAINMGNFAKTYGVNVGDEIGLSLKEKAAIRMSL
nr:SAM hydroxide adenosyltransferase [uncultured Oribacterium sp.]